jgi:hypothetical protein
MPTLGPVTTPHPGYPFDYAMNSTQLADLLADPALRPGTTFVASVKIKNVHYCDAEFQSDSSVDGALYGMHSTVCVRNAELNQLRVTGVFALRYVEPGLVESLGPVVPVAPAQLVHHGDDGWPWAFTAYTTFLVGGYLTRGGDLATISATPLQSALPALPFQSVVVDGDAGVEGIGPGRYCVFVVTAVWVAYTEHGSGWDMTADGIAFHLTGVVDDIALPGSTVSPGSPAAT